MLDATCSEKLEEATEGIFCRPSSVLVFHLVCGGRQDLPAFPTTYNLIGIQRIRFDCTRYMAFLDSLLRTFKDDGQPVLSSYLRREFSGHASCPVPLQTQGLYRTFG